jgi:hypothetical protein
LRYFGYRETLPELPKLISGFYDHYPKLGISGLGSGNSGSEIGYRVFCPPLIKTSDQPRECIIKYSSKYVGLNFDQLFFLRARDSIIVEIAKYDLYLIEHGTYKVGVVLYISFVYTHSLL